MAQRSTRRSQLAFIFTRSSFVMDVPTDPKTGAPALAEESLPWHQRFSQGPIAALYQLGFAARESWFTPSMAYLHRVADTFLRCMVGQPDIEVAREDATPLADEATVTALALGAPFSPGAELIDEGWVREIFNQLTSLFKAEVAAWDGTVANYVAERTQDLRVPECVFFHLVENHRNEVEGFPFAFVATYAVRGDGGNVEHLPLRYALTAYGADSKELSALLGKLGHAADTSDFVSRFMESGELFHPLRLTSDEAYEFLRDIPAIEGAGVLCRMPAWWRRGSSSVSVTERIGDLGPGIGIGSEALLSTTPSFTVDGEELTREEILDLLERTEGLALIKGKWVEVDHDRLKRLLRLFDEARGQEMSIFEALRASAGGRGQEGLIEVERGKWLDGLLRRMRMTAGDELPPVPSTIAATLRGYQEKGYAWLVRMNDLGFGACLADDMGLGKTIQMLAFLERLRMTAPDGVRALLVVPASLLGNWSHEIDRFASQLDYQVLAGRTVKDIDEEWAAVADEDLRAALSSVTIVTYAFAQKLAVVARMRWDVVVCDEAQAIKNPNTKQTRAIKAIPARMHIAMTGTPVENSLSNLWSIFDFMDRGLLGTSKEFKAYAKDLSASSGGYAELRQVISPFILRRLKTDKSIISDLPEKQEIPTLVPLTSKQVVLYNRIVAQMEKTLADEGMPPIQRSGAVLGALTKLKQVCNHPSQFLGQESFAPKESGKFQVLAELCRTIYERRERVLVFTQFKEMCRPLDRLLAGVFERPGLVIHGGVPAKRRTKLVERFQGEEYVPYLVLSLKAAGTGLNLTAASNVIHFDRWWNPAVENQATDRAFRIGQTHDVMVYKLVCQDTLEERIDEIIAAKQGLADDVVGEQGSWVGTLTNEEVFDLMRLGGRR